MKESKGFMKKVDKFFEDFINSKGHYLVLVILLSFVLLGVWSEYANSIFSKIMSGFYVIIFIVGLYLLVRMFLKKIDRSGEMIWPLATSIVMIMLSAMLNRPESIKASNISFVIGVMSFEIYALHIIISSCFKDKTNINKVIIFSAVFVILGYYTIFVTSYKKDATNNEIFNSLIALFSAIIGGGITLIGVGLTIKNQEKTRIKEEENKLVCLPVFAYFKEIRFLGVSKGIFPIGENVNYLAINNKWNYDGIEDIIPCISMEYKFECNPNNQIKNITFNQISISIHDFNDKNNSHIKAHHFYKKNMDLKSINVSFVSSSLYQANVELLLGVDDSCKNDEDLNKSELNIEDIVSDIFGTTANKKVFFYLDYTVTNLQNVSYSAESRFYCELIKNEKGKYNFDNYTNVSSIVSKQPHILKNE